MERIRIALLPIPSTRKYQVAILQSAFVINSLFLTILFCRIVPAMEPIEVCITLNERLILGGSFGRNDDERLTKTLTFQKLPNCRLREMNGFLVRQSVDKEPYTLKGDICLVSELVNLRLDQITLTPGCNVHKILRWERGSNPEDVFWTIDPREINRLEKMSNSFFPEPKILLNGRRVSICSQYGLRVGTYGKSMKNVLAIHKPNHMNRYYISAIASVLALAVIFAMRKWYLRGR